MSYDAEVIEPDADTAEAFDIDRSKGDFTFPENHKFDAGTGLSKDTVDYICDVKNDADWIREFHHKALGVFESKPMPTNSVSYTHLTLPTIYSV